MNTDLPSFRELHAGSVILVVRYLQDIGQWSLNVVVEAQYPRDVRVDEGDDGRDRRDGGALPFIHRGRGGSLVERQEGFGVITLWLGDCRLLSVSLECSYCFHCPPPLCSAYLRDMAIVSIHAGCEGVSVHFIS